MKKYAFLFILLFIIATVATGCGKKVVEKIDFDLYVMSQCPYGSQAEDLVYKIMGDFTDYVNFNVEYIASDNGDKTFNSLHGESEVEGNIYQLCVKQHNPDKFWDYVSCQNKNYQDLKSSFESCANENKVDYNIIKTCAQGDEGKQLLLNSILKSQEVQASGSPTFYIAGKIYSGPRTEIGLQREICSLAGDKPKKCKDLPQDKEFTAYILNDSRCTKPECDTTQLQEQLKNTFSKIKIEELDYITGKGKEFFEKNGLKTIPAVLFETQVKEADNYSQIEKYLSEVNGMYNLAIGAIHDPTKEICDNQIDDTNNGFTDCDDSDCDGDMACRQEISGRLDIFVMSQCPYGTQALNVMQEVLGNFGSNMDFHINYIASENPDGTFQSLHGQPEVDENIRELCAIKHYPTSYMDYIWCRNKDIQGDYSPCANNFPKIKTCFNSSEGKQLHSENIKLAESLGIGASPTWMVNNKYKFNGIDAETVKTNFCKYNNIDGCDQALSGQTDVPAGSCN
ncbi:MAG: hypothetical protein ABIJ91_02625 [Candidatus Kuenenbacteria bacterium]